MVFSVVLTQNFIGSSTQPHSMFVTIENKFFVFLEPFEMELCSKIQVSIVIRLS